MMRTYNNNLIAVNKYTLQSALNVLQITPIKRPSIGKKRIVCLKHSPPRLLK